MCRREARHRQCPRVFLSHVEGSNLVVGGVGTHALLHIKKRKIHVGLPGELGNDDSLAGACYRVDSIDTADRTDVALQPSRVALFHLLWRLPGDLQVDGNDRRLDVRQEVGSEAVERDPPEQHDGKSRHRDGNRIAG